MKLIRELRYLLESKHGETWKEIFQLADDVTSGPISRVGDYYYKHRVFQSANYEVWYLADHEETDAPPMDISQLHDDPEIQQRLKAKIHVPVKEVLSHIETFIAFYDGHSYAMWNDYDGEGMKAMIDWVDKDVSNKYDNQCRELGDRMDDPNTMDGDVVHQYIQLVIDAFSGE